MVVANLNQDGKEPYIRLSAPYSHIIITPPRSLLHKVPEQNKAKTKVDIIPPPSDIEVLITALNDERVHPYLESPPFPYTRDHALSFHRGVYDECQWILHHPQPAASDSTQQESGLGLLYNGCPFRDIRDESLVPADGNDNASDNTHNENGDISQLAPKIGDILISRYPFYEMPPNSEQRAKARAHNESLDVGDQELVWGIGFWLLPSHHGKGIMSAVLDALITDWLIPKMNVNVLKSSALVGNEGSVRVHQKCGFVVEGIIEKGTSDMPSHKFGGGGKRDIYVMKWVRPGRQ